MSRFIHRGTRKVTIINPRQPAHFQPFLPHTPRYDRDSPAYQDFRCAVLIRDQSKCVLCGSYKAVNVHHLKPWHNSVSDRYDEHNGVTLCSRCHNKHHQYKALPFPEEITNKLCEIVNTYYLNLKQERMKKWTVESAKSTKKLTV